MEILIILIPLLDLRDATDAGETYFRLLKRVPCLPALTLEAACNVLDTFPTLETVGRGFGTHHVIFATYHFRGQDAQKIPIKIICGFKYPRLSAPAPLFNFIAVSL